MRIYKKRRKLNNYNKTKMKKKTSSNKIKTKKNQEIEKDIVAIQVNKNPYEDKISKILRKEIPQAKNIIECKSELVKPTINTGFFPVRVPIIITESLIHIDIENKVKLDKPAIYIKNINRKVSISKCDLIAHVRKLFIKGTVKKSIEYSEAIQSNNSMIEGQIKTVIIEIPFECVTTVKYIVKPAPISDEHKTQLYKNKDDEDIFTESYNEVDRIYCQLVNANFEEINIRNDKALNNHEYKVFTFNEIIQKTSMHLTIRLIQNQNIYISNPNIV